jgi:acyl-CoA thioesterase
MMNDPLGNVAKDRFAKLLGIEILEAADGHSLVELKIEEKHLNGEGTVQGGAIFTLADYAFAVASNTAGTVTVSIDAHIAYYKAPAGKMIRAEANAESVRNRICGYKVLVTDEEGSLVASFSGMGYRKITK